MDRTTHEDRDTRDPTARTYIDLARAFVYLNGRLFDGALPGCLITLQRRKGARGYFSADRFQVRTAAGGHIDEIALNPQKFNRTDREILSTLAHEMVHLWQRHYGTPGRARYHNREWADRMEAIGLTPTNTGMPGGARVGERVTHLIMDDGPFAQAADDLLRSGQLIAYADPGTEELPKAKARKRASKTRYTCENCSLNVWGRPGIKIQCVDCQTVLGPEVEPFPL